MSRLAAFVALCRAARTKSSDGARVELTVTTTPEILARIREVDAVDLNREMEVRLAGEVIEDLSSLAIGVDVTISGATGGNSFHVARSFSELLAYQNGHFLSRLPTEFYLLQEDVASFDSVISRLEVAGYLRIPKLLDLIRRLSDLEAPRPQLEFTFLAARKLVLPVRYSASDASAVPTEAKLDDVAERVFCSPHREQREQLFKNALVKFTESAPAERRFAQLLVRFDALVEAYGHDLHAFLTEFSHDRRREEFERKRLVHLQRINAAATDLWGKLLAFPIGQAVLVTQFKSDPGSELANDALLLGAVVFVVIGTLFLFAHGQVLKDLRREIDEEITSLEGKYDPAEVRSRFSNVRGRLTFVRWVPVALIFLLLLGFLVTLVKYCSVPSWLMTSL